MKNAKKELLISIGIAGSIACVFLYAREPSFPTPDKLLLFAFFLGLIFGQAFELMKRLAPFILLLATYDLFRGFADYLNSNVNYMFMPIVDKLMFFGQLPTRVFQNVLWNGTVQWYDFAMYVMYMMHYVFPVVLAIYIWKRRESEYWRFVTTFVLVSFAGFLTFLAFPAAPPWMASDLGLIEPITRVSSDVWYALGVQDFPSLYNQISPNPVAAVPSLHAAYATLIAMFVIQLIKSKWRYLVLIYPATIYFGTVYMGEHYIIDEILGAVYAVVGFKLAYPLTKKLSVYAARIKEYNLGKRIRYAFTQEN